MTKSYSEKLKDPRWQKIRLKVFERDEWTCNNCGDKEVTLAVHHKIYLNDREPWEYELENLMTLCEVCHSDEYESRNEGERRLLQAIKKVGFLSRDLEDIIDGFENMQLVHTSAVVASALGFVLKDKNVQIDLVEKYFFYLKQKH